jgi:predicted Zn-dependent protease
VLVVALALLVVGVGDWFVWRSVQRAGLREEALRLSKQGNFAAAEPVLKDAHARNGRDVEVVRALALGYLPTDKDKDAELYLNRWCDLQPAEVEPHERRMEWCLLTRRDDQLLAEGQRLLELKPGHPRAQQAVAMLFVRQGRHAEAEQACRRFLQGAPGDAGLLYYLAQACHGQGKDQEARTVLDSLLQQHPRHVDALVLRAVLHGEAGQDDQATVLLRRALAQDPSHRLARSHLIQALARAGHAEEARRERDRMLREASAGQLVADLRVQPDNLELALRAAEALLDVGRLAEGHRLLDQILAKAPGNEAALRLRSAHRERGADGIR